MKKILVVEDNELNMKLFFDILQYQGYYVDKAIDGEEAYQKGAKMLNDFFKKELEAYLTPELNPVGREIIEAFRNDAPNKKYEEIMGKYMEENK